jgi:hypothetical protein
MPTTGVLAMLGVVVLAAAAGAGGVVDLDRPGALEALQQSNPAHYAKIETILAELPQQPDNGVARFLRTSFDAKNVSYLPMLLVTDPPQRRLSFSLDDTRYEIILTVTGIRGVVVPLK